MLLVPPQGQVRSRRGELGVARYGNRVGIWRFVELYERLSIRTDVVDQRARLHRLSEIVEAVTKASWEMMGHSYEQLPMHAEIDPGR